MAAVAMLQWGFTPVLATSSGLAISSGAMNSGVPQGSAGCRKKTARLKSISLMGASTALVPKHPSHQVVWIVQQPHDHHTYFRPKSLRSAATPGTCSTMTAEADNLKELSLGQDRAMIICIGLVMQESACKLPS